MTEPSKSGTVTAAPPDERMKEKSPGSIAPMSVGAPPAADGQKPDRFGHVPAAPGSKPKHTGTIPAVEGTTLTQPPHPDQLESQGQAVPFGREMNQPSGAPSGEILHDPQIYPTADGKDSAGAMSKGSIKS